MDIFPRLAGCSRKVAGSVPRSVALARELRRHHSSIVCCRGVPSCAWRSHATTSHSPRSFRHGLDSLSKSTSFSGLSPGQSSGFSTTVEEVSASSSAVAAPMDWLRGALLDDGPVYTAKQAFRRYGRYSDNEVAWRTVTDQMLSQGNLAKVKIEDLKDLVQVLVLEVELTLASFWDKMTEMVAEDDKNGALAKATLDDLLEVASMYCKIGCWSESVYSKAIDKIRNEYAVHVETPEKLTSILSIFSRAGRSSQKLIKLTTQLFNEAQDRLLEDAHEFHVDDVISIVESMARFQVHNVPVLQHLGRTCLHKGLTSTPIELPAQKVGIICSAYGELGWRHDTVFKRVANEIMEENLKLQRARAMGTAESMELEFSASDVALVVDAMLTLKMHTGNTTWCKWKDNYQELLDILTRSLEDSKLSGVQARPLAAASFVLGRARRGNPELQKMMYDRMMQILERGIEDASEPPQHELAKFLHGLVMMGPTRQKDYFDTQWLMHWMCHHPHLFLLSDLILVNRHLVCLGCYETDYLKEFVPWLTERMDGLTKQDIQEITQTYNEAGLRDEDLGRHFFWALGRQYQKLHVKSLGTRQRAQYRRIG